MSLSSMGWLAWVILGGVAGWIASILTKNNKRMGILANVIVGILGAFAGTFILQLAGVQGMTGFNFYTFLVAIGGAIVLLFLFNMIRGRR